MSTKNELDAYCNFRVYDAVLDGTIQPYFKPCTTLEQIRRVYPDILTPDLMDSVYNMVAETSLSLPFVMGSMLFHKMSVIDAANFIAHKWLTVRNYDITRDPEVIDILNPVVSVA